MWSNIGDGIRLAALPLLAASITSSPLLIASVTAAQYLPWLIFAPAGGALVDRWNRRRTILITQTWRGLVVTALAVLVFTSNVAIWQLCVVAFAITLGEILVDPSTVALVPTLVTDDELDRANSRISSVEVVTNDFAGGPLGAALFIAAPWIPFAIDAASYLGSVLPFSKLPRSTSAATSSTTRCPSQTSLVAEARAGFRWLRRHEILGPLTLAYVVYFFGIATNLSLLVVLVQNELDGGKAAFGWVLAIGAVGAFVGTLIGARVSRTVGAQLSLTGTVALQAVTLIAAAMAPSLPVLMIVWSLNGLGAGVQRPISRSLQQRLTPNEMLGRINVTSRIFTRGVIVIGSLAAGGLATRTGVRASFVMAGFAQLVAATMVWIAVGRR